MGPASIETAATARFQLSRTDGWVGRALPCKMAFYFWWQAWQSKFFFVVASKWAAHYFSPLVLPLEPLLYLYSVNHNF